VTNGINRTRDIDALQIPASVKGIRANAGHGARYRHARDSIKGAKGLIANVGYAFLNDDSCGILGRRIIPV
jgi:hypothetical protein